MQSNQLDGLLALKLVAEKRNFTAAAQALGVSPPAISQAIKLLEQRLGAALLSRTTRSTSLTEAGERFLSQATPALNQLLAAMEGVGSYAEKPSGILRLNLPRSVFHSYLAPFITSFSKKYPDVTVELCFEEAQMDIVKHGFDAGIRISDILAKDMVAIKLYGPVRFAVSGAPEYLEKMGRPKHPKELLSHNCLLGRLGGGVYDKWDFEQKGSEFQVQVKGSLIMNDALVLQRVAIDGAGLIYTTEGLIAEPVKAGKLEVVLSQFMPASAGFYLYYPKASQVLPKLRAFINHLKEENQKS